MKIARAAQIFYCRKRTIRCRCHIPLRTSRLENTTPHKVVSYSVRVFNRTPRVCVLHLSGREHELFLHTAMIAHFSDHDLNPRIVVPTDYHRPVMAAEVLQAFAPVKNRMIVDGTLGGGGHSRALLKEGAKIIGLDRDGGAIGYCIQHLVVYDGDSVRLLKANYRDFCTVLDQLKIEKVDGLLLDLGVSSAQVDRADRGFSFQKLGPLDMRMDQSASLSAADLVNGATQKELADIFYKYGEEPAAARVASAIVRARNIHPIADTIALAQIVERVIPKRGPRHSATRIFQALRIAVNDELGALSAVLEATVKRLSAGGRLVVITFHSLEDRVMKTFTRETTCPTVDRPEWSGPRPNPHYAFRSLSKRPILPSSEEQSSNPRSRSAKLRVLERI